MYYKHGGCDKYPFVAATVFMRLVLSIVLFRWESRSSLRLGCSSVQPK